MAKTYTGVDIGASSIKIAVCDGSTIKSIVTEQLPEGLMVDDRIVSFDAMADFIKEVSRGVSQLDKDVAFVIPSSGGITRTLQLPAMTERELEINLPYEFRDYISQGKDKYIYDYAVLSMEKDATGAPSSMTLLAVASARETILDYTEMFNRAGLKLKIALPAVAALQNLIGRLPRDSSSCCVVDFSYKNTQLHFFKNGTYDVSRMIDYGTSDIDKAIAAEKSVDERIASEYKVSNYEGVLDGANVQGVYESIAVEVGRAINFYGFNNHETNLETAYFCGGGAFVGDLVEVVGNHIDMDLQDIASVMPPAQNNSELRTLCPAAVGATIE